MKCAQCGHSKLTHATRCTMCSCPKFKEPDMPSSKLFKNMDSDGDYDDDDDDD